MFKPSAPLVHSPIYFENAVIPDTFSVLSWNVHKENFKRGFSEQILKMKAVHGLDLMLLQEARFSDALDSMAGFPFVAAANLKLPWYCSGVVTAAKAPADHSRFHLTYAKEPFILTPKNSLITIYRFRDNTGLLW